MSLSSRFQGQGERVLMIRVAWAVLALLAGLVLYAFIFGQNGWLEIRNSRQRIQELEQSVGVLEEENKDLEEEISDLKKDPLALERKAREELWLMKPNEKVIVLIRPEKPNPDGAGGEERNSPTKSP